MVHRNRGYFGAKSKGYDTTMKRAVKEQPVGISEKLKNTRVSLKRSPRKRVYVITKKIFKAGKVLVTVVHRVNMKMLCTDFCYNLYHLKTLKIKGVF